MTRSYTTTSRRRPRLYSGPSIAELVVLLVLLLLVFYAPLAWGIVS